MGLVLVVWLKVGLDFEVFEVSSVSLHFRLSFVNRRECRKVGRVVYRRGMMHRAGWRTAGDPRLSPERKGRARPPRAPYEKTFYGERTSREEGLAGEETKREDIFDVQTLAAMEDFRISQARMLAKRAAMEERMKDVAGAEKEHWEPVKDSDQWCSHWKLDTCSASAQQSTNEQTWIGECAKVLWECNAIAPTLEGDPWSNNAFEDEGL